MMEIGEALRAMGRVDWRAWLGRHHASATEIWLVLGRSPEPLGLAYLDAVEEAICFGWIDGISKTLGDHERALRFTLAAYGSAKYERLAEVKRKYDPENLFRINHNIPPS